jgi:beta-lactamase regulating signal transducer with metallopeptidase domain
MKIVKWLIKYIIYIAVTFLGIGIISYAVSRATGMEFAETLQYAGIICIVLGLLSVVGNLNTTTNVSYLQSRSISEKPFGESAREDFESRDKSFKFLSIIGIVGLVLIMASMLI